MQKKILIIEDECRMSNLLKMYLEREFFQIDIDDNGETGLVRALVDQFDAIIIDVLLPRKDGLMVLKEIRRTKMTPVLMISALCGDDIQKRSFEMGANEYMLMPFSPRDVVSRIKQLLSNPFTSKGEQIIESFDHNFVHLNSFDEVDHGLTSTSFVSLHNAEAGSPPYTMPHISL
ncbi:response regulator transcription factor [Neobacillus sp. LXY-4]|uniref:response regulator transcription factor n=1 Tax=Neobacillus sp. LXY-4 TaxID=3379826 RepID=UPI003EE1FDC0